MARPREFDTQDALNKAMHVFWAKGYKATSMQDLLLSMGISKSSFYETFGNKHDLFLAAIDEYNAKTTQPMLNRLTVGNSFISALDNILQDIIDATQHKNGRCGCLLANTAIELSPHDKETESRVAKIIRSVEEAYVTAIKQAQKQGEISPQQNARALARFVVSNINGLTVMCKANPNPDALKDIKNSLLDTLR